MASLVTPTVPFKSLRLEHEFFANPRTDSALGDADIGELADDIHKRGIVDALLVVPTKDKAKGGEVVYVVFDGQRRYLAAKEAGWKGADEVPVQMLVEKPIVLDSWEKSDALLLNVLASSSYRKGISSYELSTVAERLAIRGEKYPQIAQAIGRSDTWVSRMLAARKTASAETMKAWRYGKITDEQFKELASLDETSQGEAVKEADEIRKSGKAAAKGEVRQKIKELAAKAKASKPKVEPKAAKKTKTKNGKTNGHAKDHKNDQPELFVDTAALDTDDDAPPPPIVPPTKSELEALVALALEHPPTSDYVKGILHGVEYALGVITPELFGRAWGTYTDRASKKQTAKA